tara:strand:+ start:88 stop:462 length:375 start_codon:yes stop_codon:yes gene_type:complete
MYEYDDYDYFVYRSPETEAKYEAQRKIDRWFRKTPLKSLGKQTAWVANLLGFTTIEDVREAMERDLTGTLRRFMGKLNVGKSRKHCLRILGILGIEVPPKARVTCKCCGQEVPQIDAIDKALDW